jgi:hypothetical protein
MMRVFLSGLMHQKNGKRGNDDRRGTMRESPAAGLQWTSSSRLPRSILAIAAGADFEHLALPRYWPDRSISLDKGVSHRDTLAKYAVAYFECMTWPLGMAGARQGGL